MIPISKMVHVFLRHPVVSQCSVVLPPIFYKWVRVGSASAPQLKYKGMYKLVFSPDDNLYFQSRPFQPGCVFLIMKSLDIATMNFSTILRFSECLQTHGPFMSIKSIFNLDWLQYNLRNKFGFVARLMPNWIRNFFPSLTSICPTVEFGFDQLEASKMEKFLAISDRMSCAYTHWQLP